MFKKSLLYLAPEHLLVLSSLFTSGINFIIYVIYPFLTGASSLEMFIRDNYAGGFYLFGLASSVSVVTTRLISFHDKKSVIRYAQLSILAGVIILLFLHQYIMTLTALSCILAAVILHINGFILTFLIRLKKIRACAILQIVQPLIFLVGIVLASNYEIMWSYFYLISVVIAFLFFLRLMSKYECCNLFSENVSRTTISFRSLLKLIFACMSFPLFFQLELFFVGEFTSINLGQYTIIQKMYSSVSVAMFGGLLVYMYDETKQGFHWRKILTLPLISASLVFFLAIFLNSIEKFFNVHLFFVTIITSYIFSVAMFISFAMNVTNVSLNLKLLFFSVLIYSFVLFNSEIHSVYQMLLVTLLFYGVYVFLYCFFVMRGSTVSKC